MSTTTNATRSGERFQDANGKSGWRLSLDVWAVALALALSFLVWSGAIKRIPW